MYSGGLTHLLQAQSIHLFLPPGGTGPQHIETINKNGYSKYCLLTQVITEEFVESYTYVLHIKRSMLMFFCRKNLRSFCSAKAPQFFSAKSVVFLHTKCLKLFQCLNGDFRFEPPGPDKNVFTLNTAVT